MTYVGAPYNFIPFPEKTYAPVTRADLEVHDRIDDSLMTGEITYEIEAKTSVIVDDGKGQFFKNENGQYAIPGSTIRGLLRNNVQILSASSFDGDIDDYNLMYRNVAAGALKKEYNNILGNKTIPYGKGNISILQNVKGGAISCERGKYYIHPTKVDSVEKDMPNYYVLSERTVVEDFLNDRDDFAYGIFIDNGKCIMQNMHNVRFKKSERNGRIHYKGEDNRFYKPFFKKCSFKASGKNIKAVSEYEKYPDKGMLISTGKMNEKKAVYIIPEIDMADDKVIQVSAADVKAFNIDLKKKENTLRALFDKKDKKKAAKEADEFYGLPVEGQTKPVFYIFLNGRLYFGFTPRLRLFYDHSIKEGYRQAQAENGLYDMTTSIFGMSDTDKGSYKSKVSMADAVLISGETGEEKKIVLAEPKPSSYLDYLVQPDGNEKGKTYSSADLELRGVKQYWLRKELCFGNQNTNNENIGSQIRPLKAGSRFSGKIRFSNLTSKELGLLLWALRLEPGSNMNVGKGKPYGYGQISVMDIKTMVLDNMKAYNLDELNLSPYRNENTDSLIDKYKDITVFGVKVSELTSVKTFLKMKDSGKIPAADSIRYMSIDAKEYQNRTVRLQTVDEVLEGKSVIQEKPDNRSGAKREDIVSITKTAPDNKNSGENVGFFDGGMIFGVPTDIRRGDSVVVKITSEKNGKVFARFIRKK